MLPALFLAHGSPMLAVEETEYTDFLSQLAKQWKPKAIVIFTAHWESDILSISASDEAYETIYDFYGFPDELYAMKYPAKGSNDIAKTVARKFENQGIPVKLDYTRGLDHGSWTLLHRMYPNADIPVIQISVNPSLSPADQFKIGQSLQGLGAEDILIIGSGVTVHNLRMVNWGQTTPEQWAIEFDDWLIDKIQNQDLNSVFHYAELAPSARLAVPTPEHFVPLLIVMGSATPDANPQIIHRHYEMGTLSYLCIQF